MVPLVSVLIGTRNRPELLSRCLKSIISQDYHDLEIIVLDDASDDHKACERVVTSIRDSRVRCLRSDRQLGVAAGRNKLMADARGELLFIVDDDAYLTGPDVITSLVRSFSEDPRIGIVAGKIIDHYAGRQRILVPFSQWSRRRAPGIEEKPGFVSYFLGGCHGIRKTAVEDVGGYSDGFVFGEEEMDLSFRVLNAGYSIYYNPEVSVWHESQPRALHFTDNPRRGEIYHQVRNRLFLAYKYLPGFYVPFYLAHWLSRAMYTSVRQRRLSDFVEGLRDGCRWIAQVKREPVNGRVLAYLRQHHGRLWY